MKTYSGICLFLLCLFTSHEAIYSQQLDTATCLVLKGNLYLGNKAPLEECTVQLLTKNEVIKEQKLFGQNQSFEFSLPRDQYFAIKLMAKGQVPRIISVDTRLPAQFQKKTRFAFKSSFFTTEEAKSLNEEAFDYPIAMIQFD